MLRHEQFGGNFYLSRCIYLTPWQASHAIGQPVTDNSSQRDPGGGSKPRTEGLRSRIRGAVSPSQFDATN